MNILHTIEQETLAAREREDADADGEPPHALRLGVPVDLGNFQDSR